MCTQSTTYTTTTSSTVGYTAMTSSGNEIHLTVKDAEMSNVDMVGLVHEISNSTYTSCNCLTGTNDWEIKASTWVGGLRANNNNFTLAIIDGTGNVLATQTTQTNGNITALTYLSVKATGLGTGPYYAVISYNKNSGSGDGFLNMHGWTLRIREDVPTTEAVVESNAFSFQPGYRFGFQGQERDDEIKGSGNSLDFGARIYDPRLGRFLSIDRFYRRFSHQSTYSFAGNTPIMGSDINGDSLFIGGNKGQAFMDILGALKSEEFKASLSVTDNGKIISNLNSKALAEMDISDPVDRLVFDMVRSPTKELYSVSTDPTQTNIIAGSNTALHSVKGGRALPYGAAPEGGMNNYRIVPDATHDFIQEGENGEYVESRTPMVIHELKEMELMSKGKPYVEAHPESAKFAAPLSNDRGGEKPGELQRIE